MYQYVQNAGEFFFHLRVCFALAGDPVEKSKIKVIQAIHGLTHIEAII